LPKYEIVTKSTDWSPHNHLCYELSGA